MTIFYIKMKIRAGGGNFRAAGGSFSAAGCSPLLFLFMGNTNLLEHLVSQVDVIVMQIEILHECSCFIEFHKCK